MPTYQTTGIVIGRTNFGEADRIIRLLTPEHGKVSVVAKGVRKIKSRMAGHLESFGEVSLMCAKGRSLDIITSARLVWYPHELSANFANLSVAFMTATIIDRLLEEQQSSYPLYEVMRDTIHALNAPVSLSLLELYFKLRVLDCLGLRPNLEGCDICGRTDEAAHFSFSPSRGGLVCSADSDPGDLTIAPTLIKFMRLILSQTLDTLARITGGTELSAAGLPIIDAFYEHHTGKTYRPVLSSPIV